MLTGADLNFWSENGYVVLHNAVSSEHCQNAAQAIYDFLEMDPDQPDTWYGTANREGIWIPLLHHPAFWANRESPRIHRAFAQLWGREDLWITVDQGGMNPPERPGLEFPRSRSALRRQPGITHTFRHSGHSLPNRHRGRPGRIPVCARISSNHRNMVEEPFPRSKSAQRGSGEIRSRANFRPAGDLIIWPHALPHCAAETVRLAPGLCSI